MIQRILILAAAFAFVALLLAATLGTDRSIAPGTTPLSSPTAIPVAEADNQDQPPGQIESPEPAAPGVTEQLTVDASSTPTAPAALLPNPTRMPTTEARPSPTTQPSPSGLWISAEEVAELPMSGTAWETLYEWAQRDASEPRLCDQDDETDGIVFAKALVYLRTGETRYRDEVREAIAAVQGTEQAEGCDEGGRRLAANRNLQAYPLAADMIRLADFPDEDAAFRDWLWHMLTVTLWWSGDRYGNLIESARTIPSNGGNHARASVIAAALYLGDQVLLDMVANRFHDWLGRNPDGWKWDLDEADWQADPDHFRGINAAGATIEGHNVDGVLPEDMKRSGRFRWPPRKEDYVWEGLQGVVVTAELLSRAGYDAWRWEDRAIWRAFNWLSTPHFAPSGDEPYLASRAGDEWQPWLVNAAYGADFPAQQPVGFGKGGIGFTDWTHGE